MKKKKIILLSALAVLVLAAAAVAGSLAYFTAEETAHNVITTGGVDVQLNEWSDDGEEMVPFEDITGVMPGVEISKIAEAENTGASAAWVRMRADVYILLAEDREGTVDLSLVSIDFNTADWTYQDGWFYYNAPLEPGEVTAPLFTTVRFDEQMGNLYQNSTAFVDVELQAVQTANNGGSATEAAGWPAGET